MLQELFHQQKQNINHFFEHIDIEKAEKFLHLCKECKGLIVFTGIGKSGIIAEKIAMTMVSTGTKALYLPTTSFLHGDIGILTPNDVVIVISKSGETEELIALISFIRKRGTKFLSIVSNPQSRLAKMSDASVSLPVLKELCPFDLAPTTSTEIQLIFGDALAIALMIEKGIMIEEYAESHPSGAIGKKTSLLVDDIMIKNEHVPLCSPKDKLVDVLVELSNKKCGCLMVVNEQNKFLGIFTDGDLRRSLQARGSEVLELPIEQLMTTTATWTTRDILAWQAMKIMQKDPKKWIMVLPVLDEKEKVVGLVRMHDVVQAGLT